MPQVPQYQEQYRYANNQSSAMGGRVHPVQMPSARELALPAQIAAESRDRAGKDWQMVGKALTDLGILGMKTYDDYNTTKAQQAANQLNIEFINWQAEQSKKVGEAGANSAKDYQEWMGDRMNAIKKSLGNDIQRGRFDLMTGVNRARWGQWASDYGERQTLVFQNSEDEAMVANAATMIMTDPFGPGAAEGAETINRGWFRFAMRNGKSPLWAQAKSRESLSAAHMATLNGMIDAGNMQDAEKYLGMHGASFTPEQRAKAVNGMLDGWDKYVGALGANGDIQGMKVAAGQAKAFAASAAATVRDIKGRIAATGAQNLDAALEVGAGMKVGQKYTWGANDCSGHTSQIWQAALKDTPEKRKIFGRDGEHVSAAEIMRNASEVTGKLYRGGEVNAQSVGGGWVLATTGQSHAKGRWNGVGHIVTTFKKPDGSIWVSEAKSDRDGQGRQQGAVRTLPLEKWLSQYQGQGREVLGVDLSSLPVAAQGTPPSWHEYSGSRGDSIAERNHNPGNIRRDGKNYDSYASDADGWRDMSAVLQKDGYRNLTVQQIAERYVNGEAGKPVAKSYLEAIQAQGFNLDEVPDLGDTKTLARLMKGMAVGESPLGKRYSVEQIHSLISDSEGGQGTNMRQAMFNAKIDKTVKAAEDKHVREITKDSKDAIKEAEFGQTGRLRQIATDLRMAGLDEQADRYDGLVKTFEDTADARAWASAAPLSLVAERAAEISRAIDPADRNKEQRPLAELERLEAEHKAITSVLQARKDAYDKDPAAAAQADRGMVSLENDTPEDRARDSLALQEMNGVSEMKRRVLTKEQAGSFKSQWTMKNSREKAQFILGPDGIVKQYGQYASKVMSEMGLSPMDSYIANVMMNDPGKANYAQRLWAEMDTPKEKVPDIELDDKVNNLWVSVRDGSAVFKTIQAQAMSTNSAESWAFANELATVAKKMLKKGVDSDKVKEFIDMGCVTSVGDDRAIILPGKTSFGNPSEDTIDEAISLFGESAIKKAFPEDANGLRRKDLIQAVKEKGVWVNAPDGDGVVLVDPVTQAPFLSSKREVIRISQYKLVNGNSLAEDQYAGGE